MNQGFACDFSTRGTLAERGVAGVVAPVRLACMTRPATPGRPCVGYPASQALRTCRDSVGHPAGSMRAGAPREPARPAQRAAANAASAHASVAAISVSVCAAETKPASNALGAR